MNTDRPFGRVGEGASLSFMRGEPYLRLLQAYVLDRISAVELRDRFRQLFLHGTDNPERGEELWHILNHMFGVLDAFTTDRAVIAADPEFFVPEKKVREEAVATLQKLRILNRSHS